MYDSIQQDVQRGQHGRWLAAKAGAKESGESSDGDGNVGGHAEVFSEAKDELDLDIEIEENM